MTIPSIGEFEQLVLLAVLRLGEEAYGVPVLEESRGRTGRSILRPAVYVALGRLEDKGLLRSRQGSPLPERGGRARKYYEVTPAGLGALRETREALLSMWDGLQAILDEG
jgi:DNA-binding PadR family transcriptional regulator